MTAVATPPKVTREGKALTLDNLRKTYQSRGRESFEAVKGINLEIQPGELVALLGPSGCGKTTTLRMIAGLETVTSGDIRVGDQSIPDLPPGQRNIGVGFESYALYPPMTIRGNLEYGLRARKVPDATARVDEMARRLEMTDMLDLRPSGLSSGQKQRVALARALVRNPPILLLDEPLSHLDTTARNRVRRELKLLQREFGYTTIVVTHDQLEALSLADRMAVMDGGIIQQFGTPDEMFNDPANRFVADFVGEPKINLAPATGGDGSLRIGSRGVLRSALRLTDGEKVEVGIRPQDCELEVVGADASPGTGIPGIVSVFEDLLEFGLATIKIDGVEDPMIVQTRAGVDVSGGDRVSITAPPERVYAFTPDTGDRIR